MEVWAWAYEDEEEYKEEGENVRTVSRAIKRNDDFFVWEIETFEGYVGAMSPWAAVVGVQCNYRPKSLAERANVEWRRRSGTLRTDAIGGTVGVAAVNVVRHNGLH